MHKALCPPPYMEEWEISKQPGQLVFTASCVVDFINLENVLAVAGMYEVGLDCSADVPEGTLFQELD